MILSELNTLLDALSIPVETGQFSDRAPDTYAVLAPLTDTFDLYADDRPQWDTQAVRIVLLVKGNYLAAKRRITAALEADEFTITDRTYVQFDRETGYHQYAIDVEKTYFFTTEG